MLSFSRWCTAIFLRDRFYFLPFELKAINTFNVDTFEQWLDYTFLMSEMLRSLQGFGNAVSVCDQLYVSSRHERQFDHRHLHRCEWRQTEQPSGKLHEWLVLELPRVERRVDGQDRLGQRLWRMAVHRWDTARNERQ